ncbi:MAG: GerMN domain-containing protein [Candidatus Nanopelagicales bacterium]
MPDFGPRLYREFARVATCKDPITESLTHMFQVAPVDPDYTSLWKPSTEVLSVATSGSTATVDVSEFPALGASFESAAVQQVVWTATAADKSVKRVRLLVDGRTPESGHVDWSKPISRANALKTLANVWILAPSEGATVSSPVKVRVYGTGWEGNVPIIVFQGDKQVAATFVTTMMGGFAEASTTIKLPAGEYVIHAYNDNGLDESLDLWDTKAFTVG